MGANTFAPHLDEVLNQESTHCSKKLHSSVQKRANGRYEVGDSAQTMVPLIGREPTTNCQHECEMHDNTNKQMSCNEVECI